MVLDPVATFFIYIGGIAAVFAVAAFIADEWTAKAERDARRRARDEARRERRATLMTGEGSSPRHG